MIDLNTIPKCVINIKERTERLAQFKQEFSSFFPNQEVIVIEANVGKPALKFIAQSHKKCIQLAKDNDWEHVLIMEDDVKLIPGAFEYAQECLNNTPSSWDLLLGGVYTSTGLTKENSYWNKTGKFSALHFYIVNKNAYDRILRMDEASHIDTWMVKVGGLNCFVMDQFVAIQYAGYSDNADRVIDYSNMLKGFKIFDLKRYEPLT